MYPGGAPRDRELGALGHLGPNVGKREAANRARHPADDVVAVPHLGRRRGAVGRVTSAVDGLALAYVRVEVPEDAELEVGGRRARLH